jgi:hypothetical protein
MLSAVLADERAPRPAVFSHDLAKAVGIRDIDPIHFHHQLDAGLS